MTRRFGLSGSGIREAVGRRVITALAVVGALAIFQSIGTHVVMEIRKNERAVLCRRNLRQIWEELERYRSETGSYPVDLRELTSRMHPQALMCPSEMFSVGIPEGYSYGMPWLSYYYVSGLVADSPPAAVQAFCPPENWAGNAQVLYHSGRVEELAEERFRALTNSPALMQGLGRGEAPATTELKCPGPLRWEDFGLERR